MDIDPGCAQGMYLTDLVISTYLDERMSTPLRVRCNKKIDEINIVLFATK